MALIPQDITGLDTANTYIDIDYFKDYHDQRGNDISALTDTVIEQLIIKAMDYMESVFYGAYKGEQLNDTQSTLFPRIIDDVTVLPKNIKDAQAILGLKANDGELMEDQDKSIKKEKLDVLEIEYDEYSSPQKRYLFVYNVLKPYLMGSTSTKKVVRT
jgi:hypothetical protein